MSKHMMCQTQLALWDFDSFNKSCQTLNLANRVFPNSKMTASNFSDFKAGVAQMTASNLKDVGAGVFKCTNAHSNPWNFESRCCQSCQHLLSHVSIEPSKGGVGLYFVTLALPSYLHKAGHSFECMYGIWINYPTFWRRQKGECCQSKQRHYNHLLSLLHFSYQTQNLRRIAFPK